MENKSVKIQCPAKINLTLKVLNRRQDGFHNIESIMQTISLFDYLTISIVPAESLKINLSGNSTEIPYNEKNLVYKAAKLFFEEFGNENFLVNIFIKKNIPVAAGLAGGSTDAAGTLYGLNKLFANPFNRQELHNLCAKLGSDLNFCLEGGRQKTTGRGEILEPLEFEEFNVSLIKPENLGISAKEAYTKFAAKKAAGFSNDGYVNDLEWGLIDDYLDLRIIKNLYPKSVMSGSGSTYYLVNSEFAEVDGCFIKNNLKAIPHGVREISTF